MGIPARERGAKKGNPLQNRIPPSGSGPHLPMPLLRHTQYCCTDPAICLCHRCIMSSTECFVVPGRLSSDCDHEQTAGEGREQQLVHSPHGRANDRTVGRGRRCNRHRAADPGEHSAIPRCIYPYADSAISI
eukprot:20486-Rhodomonas_salina.1